MAITYTLHAYTKKKIHLNYTISEFFEILIADGYDQFIRIGRSFIVNINFISCVFPQRGYMLLSDGESWDYRLELPCKTLKRLCAHLCEMFSSDNKMDSSED